MESVLKLLKYEIRDQSDPHFCMIFTHCLILLNVAQPERPLINLLSVINTNGLHLLLIFHLQIVY